MGLESKATDYFPCGPSGDSSNPDFILRKQSVKVQTSSAFSLKNDLHEARWVSSMAENSQCRRKKIQKVLYRAEEPRSGQ